MVEVFIAIGMRAGDPSNHELRVTEGAFVHDAASFATRKPRLRETTFQSLYDERIGGAMARASSGSATPVTTAGARKYARMQGGDREQNSDAEQTRSASHLAGSVFDSPIRVE